MRPLSLALASLLVLALSNTCFAQTTANRRPTLEQRLNFGLRARIPSEIAFVAAVNDTVNRGELPVKVVDRVFFWARLKAGQRTGRRPIIYFQPGLTSVAQQLGISIRPDSAVGAAP